MWTTMDELPQLFNVFVGKMSLVGPRPHAVVMNKAYADKIENFMFRHIVKPGITGLAQSKGYLSRYFTKAYKKIEIPIISRVSSMV